tara:strand:- start:397 stop:1491 length:1095 start_codon:yes stop_codon:yes gene_type:complete
MNICLIGHGIPCLILANVLINKNIKISIFDEINYKKKFETRTLGVTKKNIAFLKKEKINLKNNAWFINNIKIFNEAQNNKPILNFGPVNDKLFSIIKYTKFLNLLKNNLKKKKLINFIKKNKTTFYNSIIDNKNEFDLIINFNENNKISKELFFRKEYKNYKSLAYTTLINHQKCENRIAYQVFTKFGPIAFLPCSNKQTSIVFSIFKQQKNINEDKVLELIKKYNKNFIIKSFSKLEKFKIKGSILKNYYKKNILCFGDNIHKIHPLAGQGLNMTIRDINILSELIDNKLDLGLCLDKSVLKEFENKTKHYNYLFANSIDFIFELFKLDSKLKNNYSNKIFNFLEKNSFFKKYSINFADKGLI